VGVSLRAKEEKSEAFSRQRQESKGQLSQSVKHRREDIIIILR